MASSSIAVVGRDSHRMGQSQEGSTSLTDLDSDLSSYQNMEDASPGTIIFSPQDLRPLTIKKAGGGNSSAANIADSSSSVSGYNSGSPNSSSFQNNTGSTFHSRTMAKSGASSARDRQVIISMSEMTQAEKKAEDIATSIEKLKDIEGPVACQFCGKVMLSGKTLVQHMSIHAEYKPFQCPHCPKSFTRKVQLQGHLVVHGIEKQFECPVCHQRFSRRDCVKVHMRIHDKTKCAFCEVCHKSFLTMGALNIHMRIHRGEKPFKCHLCGKCFTQKNHLITHIKRHTNVQDVHFAKKLGPRMFQCEHCDRSFIRLSDYERHVQWNHGAVADVNNLPSSSTPLTTADGDEGVVKAPRDVVRERSKLYKKQKKEPVVMCTSATQTDDSGGHIIIPRQYRQQYEMEQQQKATPAPSEPSDTPRHIDEDTYDAYDEGMDRNYSSDDEEADVSEENQPHQRIFNIDSTSIVAPTSSDPARDAAFDAIINSSNETSPNKAKLKNCLEEAEHILPDSLDADQPNERVFIIQNEENDSYEPTVTAGDYRDNASLRASEVISSVSASSSSLGTNKGATNSFFSSSHRPSKAVNNAGSEQQPASGRRIPDLNAQLDSDNFMELVQNSYQNLAKGVPGTITSSVPPSSGNMTGQDMTGIGGGGLRSMQGMPFVGAAPKNVTPLPQVFKSKRGRPKTKRTGIKGAAQLRLIRKSMMSFISDVEEKKEACRSAGLPEGMPGEEDGMEDDALSCEEDGDPRSALERQVLMGVDDLQSGANRPQRKRPLIKHGEDFLCASKTCRLCRPNLKNVADKGQAVNMMPAPGTLLKAQIKTENKNVVVKKEQNLSQLAKKGSRKVAEIVNLLEFGVKNLDELEARNQQSVTSTAMYNSSLQKSALPFRPRMVDLGDNTPDEVYLAKTSVGDSIVSPPVDVQSFCIPTYSCKLCGREFRFEGKLHRHIESVHQKKNIFTSDVRPGRGQKTQFMGYTPASMDLEGAGSSSNTMIVSSLSCEISLREQVHISHQGDGANSSSDAGDGEIGASSTKQDTHKVKNPEIEALRSEWDDDDNEDEDDAEVRPTVTKPQPIYNATPLQQPHPASPDKRQQQQQQQHQQQRQNQSHSSGINYASDSMAMPIVTRDIQPMVTTVTDVYSGGVVVNMNKLTGLLPKTESKMEQDSDLGHGSGLAQTTTVASNSLESNSLDSKCQKLLQKLFDRQLLVQCGLEEDHVSAVLGRVLQHYGVKMIEDYGQGQYEVLKYNLWRLMEWKVTIEQMEEFYSENKTVEEMMDDIMNERVPLVPHEVITAARAQEQQEQAARQQQLQQQQEEEIVVPRMMDGSDHLVVEQQVEGEQVVMQGTEHMIVDQGSGQHIVVQGVDHNGQQIMLQNISDGSMHHDGHHHHHHGQQIVLQQSQELSHDTAMLVQQVMSGHPQLAGVTQVVVAQDLSPEMLQGAHIVTIDPATGQVLSQVSADQVVLATHDGTIVNGSGQGGGGGTVVSLGGQQQHHQEAIVVSQEQMMMLQQQYNSQQQQQRQQQSSGSAP